MSKKTKCIISLPKAVGVMGDNSFSNDPPQNDDGSELLLEEGDGNDTKNVTLEETPNVDTKSSKSSYEEEGLEAF